MGLHGDQDIISRRQCVDGKHTQGRAAVQQDHVISVPDAVQIFPEYRFPAHGIDQCDFQAREFNVGREKVNPFLMVDDTCARKYGFVHDKKFQQSSEGGFNLVRVLIPQAGGQGPLGIHVYQEDLLAHPGKAHPQADRCEGFSDAAFLIADSCYRCHFCAPSSSRKFVVKVQPCFLAPSRRPRFRAVFRWKKNKDKPPTRCTARVCPICLYYAIRAYVRYPVPGSGDGRGDALAAAGPRQPVDHDGQIRPRPGRPQAGQRWKAGRTIRRGKENACRKEKGRALKRFAAGLNG